MLNIKGVIFDMDGLMIDTERHLIRFWCQACKEFGYECTPEMIYPMRSMCTKVQGNFRSRFRRYSRS